MAIPPRKSGMHAKNDDLRPAWENPNGKPFILAIPHKKATLTPKLARRLGEILSGARLSWRSRFFPMAIMPKPATGLGKFPAKPVYDGDSARKSGNGAKTRDSRAAWEKSKRNPFIMAISQEKAALTPKPATFDRLWENPSGTRL